ncbi:MAG: hypothetical protein SF028_14785 [Candidatus Sumerlaeia bacterium]|nr:hypothetical protein [Candidatus Sumerlaeia bacterium]
MGAPLGTARDAGWQSTVRPDQPLFAEEQSFSPNLLATVTIIEAVALAIGVGAMVLDNKFEPALLAVVAAGLIVVLLLLSRLRLLTVVVPGALAVRLGVLANRTIALRDIASAEVRTYRPLRDYGGRGYRRGLAGTAYNARGDRGVQLVLKSGERVLIGSQRSEELLAVIQAARP